MYWWQVESAIMSLVTGGWWVGVEEVATTFTSDSPERGREALPPERGRVGEA